MTVYTIKKLDNRFTLHRNAGFEIMIEWPPAHPLDIYQPYSKFEKTVRTTLGTHKQYYRYANPHGTWATDRLRMHDGRWRHRIFFKEHKHLTLVLMN